MADPPSPASDRAFGEDFAEVARRLQAETTSEDTLQAVVDLAATAIRGCEHAGITTVAGGVSTPAASDDLPRQVDRIQYETGEGPCLSAIREHEIFQTDDLRAEGRWPCFSSRAAAETGVRSMLSFRLFLEQDTLGALNLYSKQPRAFDEESRRAGEVFAAHAAVAIRAAWEHERVEALQDDLQGSRRETRRYAQQAELAIALQRSMLTELPDLSPLAVAARYVPAAEAAEVGGDWYDAFRLPHGATAIVVGDLAGHDTDAAVAMGQARSMLRALAVDRQEAPHALLTRFDRVLAHLHGSQSATCVYAQLDEQDGAWTARLANAGHLPPLQLTEDGPRYVDNPAGVMLGVAFDEPRSTATVALPPGSTLLLYTDGLVERRDRGLDEGLAELRDAAAARARQPVEQLCDELLSLFAAEPSDDVCLLALRVPSSQVGRA